MAVVFRSFVRAGRDVFDETDQGGVTMDGLHNWSIPCPLVRPTVVNILRLVFSDIQSTSKHVDQCSDLQINAQGGG
jgi:hypothetical protein